MDNSGLAILSCILDPGGGRGELSMLGAPETPDGSALGPSRDLRLSHPLRLSFLFESAINEILVLHDLPSGNISRSPYTSFGVKNRKTTIIGIDRTSRAL